jgi:hypothetical protein
LEPICGIQRTAVAQGRSCRRFERPVDPPHWPGTQLLNEMRPPHVDMPLGWLIREPELYAIGLVVKTNRPAEPTKKRRLSLRLCRSRDHR